MRTSAIRVASCGALVVVSMLCTACSKPSDGQQDQAASKDQPSAVTQASHEAELGKPADLDTLGVPSNEVPAPPATTPVEAVTNFLEAVRRGDDGQAEALLSEMARAKTREMDLAVAPPGSSTARFEVGATEFPSEWPDSAHVASTWTDVDNDGHDRTDEIVWILRKETDGWRIAGMATKLYEDRPPLILNFEDPQDMVRKQKAADEEIRRHQDVQNSAAGAVPDAQQN